MTTTVKDCFTNAKGAEDKGKKHKGLLFTIPDQKKAEAYILKAKDNLLLCNLYKEKRFDYKIPEEWYYTMYYCALAILAKFGVESRNQRCTALFLRAVTEKGITTISSDFLDHITVHGDKDEISSVDEREQARYGASIQSEEIIAKYDMMMNLCKQYISEIEEIVYSDKDFIVPKELLK